MGHLTEHEAASTLGLCTGLQGKETQHNTKNRKRGRGWMERADVMQPPAARTPVLCGR